MTVEELTPRRPVVVVGYDGSAAARAAVSRALEMAGPTGFVHLVHAFHVPDDALGGSYYLFAEQDARAAARDLVDELRHEEARLAGPAVKTHVVLGAPASELCRLAAEHDADAIVVGTRGVGRVHAALLGSVAHDVLHQADRPVTVIPAGAGATRGDGERTVVAGYDGSAAARAAVEHATGRVRGGGRLVLVHSYRVPPDHLGAPYYERALEHAADRAARLIDELERDCGMLADVEYEPDVLAGAPGEAICRVAEHRGAEEIVIGTRGVGRITALLGSTAHDVLHRATCPVTVIPRRMVDDDGDGASRRPGFSVAAAS